MFDEAINGDISNDPNSPSVLDLVEGTNTLSATTGGGEADQEYITVTVPDGFELASINLSSFSSGGDAAFIGVQEGTTFTEPLNDTADRGNFLGYALFNGTQVNTDILDNVGNGSGAIGFTGALPSGTYTFAIQQLTPTGSSYDLDFNVAAVTVAPPPTGEPPVVSFEVDPSTFSEEDPNNLVEWKWTVAGDFPEGGITVNMTTTGGGAPFAFTEQFAASPEAEFIDADIVGFDPENGDLNILLEAPEASFRLFFVDDILEEGVQEFEFFVVDGEGYTVDADMSGGIFTITDDNGGPGVGPTVGLSVSETELTEGDTFTVTFTVDESVNPIPAEGVQVLVQSDVPGALGQFDLADLGNITTTGIAGLPEVGDGGGGSFFVTITEATATITLGVFDDILAEEPLPITFTLANGEEYEVDSAAASTTLTISDQVQDPGPTVSLSVDNTELIEGGDPITLTIEVEGDIPAGGLPILINDVASAQSQVRSLTEFDVSNVTTTGIDGFPSPAEGDSGFFVTVTEPTATITLAAFDDGADEDEATEQFNFAVIDGEAYEVDPAASSVTVSIADPVDTPPPVGDLPILSFTASTDALNEAEGTALTFNFSVEGQFPEEGVVVRFDENFFDTGDQIDFNIFDLENLEFFDFEETSPGRFTVDYLLSAPEGSLTTGVFDDNVAEAEFIYSPGLLPIPDANYALNPDASSVNISIVDGVEGTGGPVVTLAVSDTELAEGDPLTLTLTAEGEIPDGGIEINVDTGVGAALGDFISTDETGVPNIEFTGFAGVPAPNGEASGFSAVMVDNTATVTLDVVNDGFGEDTETFDISLLDGENYDVSSSDAIPVSISDADPSLPVVGLEVTPEEKTEADDGPEITLTFNVEGEIPAVEFDAEGNYVSGGLPVEFDGSDVIAIFEQITGGPIVDGVEVTRFPADETDTTYEFTLLQNTATVSVILLDDVIQEEAQDFSFNLIPSPDGPYSVDPDAVGGTVTVTDGLGGAGIGPTVGLSVSETELTEEGTVTLNFTVEGDIPAEGLEVLVQSPTPGAIGEFSIFDADGNFLIETTGLADFPISADGIGSSFLATITEPDASITLSVFDDGPNEGLETLAFELVDGEVYEVAPDASSVEITIDDGGTPPPPQTDPVEVLVTVESLSPVAGNFLTPVWVGFHNGEFDLYNRGEAATPGLESLAEDGSTALLSEEFVNSGFGAVDGVVLGPVGLEGPIDPGEIASATFTLDPSADNSQFFSYASMIIPSNDAFIANGDPMVHSLFDADGNFVGADFIVAGGEVLDAGTEVNDELVENTAFFSQAEANTGVDENGTVELHPGFIPGGRILSEDGTTEGAPAAFTGADFTADGYQVVRITVEEVTSVPPIVGLIEGTDGDDRLRGTEGNDVMVALDGNDRLFADGGSDILDGGDGRDRLFGGDERDILIGNMGDDFLNGGAGDDVLMGVTGRDVLVGGEGADLFVFGVGDGGARNQNELGNDLIRDFEVGIDKIGLVEGELTFADITITQSGSRTLLGVASTGEVLAALKGVDASSLGESSFEIVPNVATVEEAMAIL